MNIKLIRNDKDLRDAFKRLEFVYQAKEGTPEADEMEGSRGKVQGTSFVGYEDHSAETLSRRTVWLNIA